MSLKAVRNLLDKFGMPRRGFDIDALRIAYILDLREKAAGRSSEGEYDLTAERARLAHHQANVEALKEMQLRGELIPAPAVADYFSGLVAAARAKLLAVHSKMRSRFAGLPQDVIDEIQRLHHDVLEELAEDGIPAEYREKARVTIDRFWEWVRSS